MKRPLYYLLCAIACASMVGATMPMAAIAEAMQPQASAGQQAQADATVSDTGKAKDGASTNVPAADTATSNSTATPADASQATPANANTTDTAATPSTAATPNTTAATNSTPTPSLRAQAAGTPEAISVAAETTYAHSATATQNGVTFTVSWNDAPAGTATTFHVTQANGSSQAKARMDVPTYWDGGSQESVCDPSRPAWAGYCSLGTAGHDFTFDFTASGTYRIHFYFMDNDRNDPQNDKGIYYLRTTAEVTVNDAARPSVTQIVNDAVAQCGQETNGSEYDMALWLHDWTLDQLEYDHGLNWCSAESGLTRHQGTCESYQRIYSKLLDAAGIANGRITGNGHTWNAVKIGGKWCQMDLTWDDTSDNWYGDLDQRHLYFGLTDELMAIAHSDHTANYQKDDYAYRSTDLSNNYFVRNGKADEWAEKYADRIQQHLDAKEESFSIDADNQSFPPSISGIQNGIVAHAMNQREWKSGGAKVELAATSNVTIIDVYHWAVSYEFKASHQRPAHSAPLADGDYRLLSPDGSLGVGAGPAAAESGAASALSFERDAGSGSYTITDKSSGKALTARALELNGPVTMEEPDGSAAQLWDVTANGDGTLRIQPASDHSLTADMCGAWSRGSRMLLWACGPVENQRFVAGAAAPLADGDYRLLSPDGSLGVGAGPAAAESGAASALSFERDAGSGSYTITDKSSGKALTARALELNGPVTMEEPDGSAAQLWDVTANGDGTLRIQPASDHSLTADMCGAWSRGSRMLLWACGPVENQRFVAGAEKN